MIITPVFQQARLFELSVCLSERTSFHVACFLNPIAPAGFEPTLGPCYGSELRDINHNNSALYNFKLNFKSSVQISVLLFKFSFSRITHSFMFRLNESNESVSSVDNNDINWRVRTCTSESDKSPISHFMYNLIFFSSSFPVGSFPVDVVFVFFSITSTLHKRERGFSPHSLSLQTHASSSDLSKVRIPNHYHQFLLVHIQVSNIDNHDQRIYSFSIGTGLITFLSTPAISINTMLIVNCFPIQLLDSFPQASIRVFPAFFPGV